MLGARTYTSIWVGVCVYGLQYFGCSNKLQDPYKRDSMLCMQLWSQDLGMGCWTERLSASCAVCIVVQGVALACRNCIFGTW